MACEEMVAARMPRDGFAECKTTFIDEICVMELTVLGSVSTKARYGELFLRNQPPDQEVLLRRRRTDLELPSQQS